MTQYSVLQLRQHSVSEFARRPKMLGTPYKFPKQGQSGIEMSEVWKELPQVADELCVQHGRSSRIV